MESLSRMRFNFFTILLFFSILFLRESNAGSGIFLTSLNGEPDSIVAGYSREQVEEAIFNSWRGRNLLGYLTNGYLKRWEPEGEPEGSPESWKDESLKIKYGTGYIYKDRRATGWTSGPPSDSVGAQLLFSLPQLTMASCYKMVPPGINFHKISYVIKVVSKAEKQDSLRPMDPILSFVINYRDEDGKLKFLRPYHIRVADVDTFYTGMYHQFDLPVFLIDGSAADIKVGFDFYTHNRTTLYIDHIDIYDNEVGIVYLAHYIHTRETVARYIKWLKKRLPMQEQLNKEFLLFGMTPPHSAYSVEPYRQLEKMLKELGIR